MTLANLGFEAGSAGAATSWTLAFQSSAREIAGFTQGPIETFESGWLTNETSLFVFSPGDLSAALFAAADLPAPIAMENFEQGWSNNAFMLLSFPSIAGTPDMFEDWVVPFLAVLGDVTTATALFDTTLGPNGYEAFENSWDTNETWVSDWGDVTPDPATWSGQLAASAETFNGNISYLYTAANATNLLTSSLPHGLGANYGVRILPAIGGTLPSPLVANQVGLYKVDGATVTANDLKLKTPSGVIVDLTTDGSGELRFDSPTEYWTSFMVTL